MSYINKIDVLLVCPNEVPKMIKINNTLRTKQKLVKGRIEICYLEEDKEVCLICNDEGKMDGSLPNRDIGYDVIYGNFLIVGDDQINGDFKSLNKEQLKKYQERFDEHSIAKTNSKITAQKLVHYLFRRRY